MAFSEFEHARYLKMMRDFIEELRSSQAVSTKIDYISSIEKQSVMLHELSSSFSRDGTTQRFPIAKITYVRTKKHWVLYGMRASGKWMRHSTYPSLVSALATLKLDPDSNFFG